MSIRSLSSRLLPEHLKAVVRSATCRYNINRAQPTIEAASLIVPTAPSNLDIKQQLEKLLLTNIVPFWSKGIIDNLAGGYQLNHDVRGSDLGHSTRYVISQARTMWFFSKLANSAYAKPEHRAAAEHGYAYLQQHFYDQQCGGYIWAVTPEGVPTSPDTIRRPVEALFYKDLCAQAYMLYALSELALMTKDPTHASMADEMFELILLKAEDSRYGGYFQLFTRDWGVAAEDVPNFYGASTSAHKTFAGQVHMLEAMTCYFMLRADERVRTALENLLESLVDKFLHKPVERIKTTCWRDWRPVWSHGSNRSYYGHDLEFITLIGDAIIALGQDIERYGDLMRQMFASCVWYGMDRSRGGFFGSGPYGLPANDHEKTDWVQAEAMLCCMFLYRFFDQEIFLNTFVRQLGWINDSQADWANGEWHRCIDKHGAAFGPKAGKWKAPYHSGRSVLQSLSLWEGIA